MAEQIPNDLVPLDLVPQEQVPNDLVPAENIQQQPTFDGGIPVDIFQEVNAPQLQGLLPSPEPTPLQQFEQNMMAPIKTGERVLKSAGRGVAGIPIQLGELSPAFPGGEQPIKEAITKVLPPLEPLFEHKSEGWVENIAEVVGGFGSPEGALLAAKPGVKALTKAALTESQARFVQEGLIKRAAKSAMGEFEPLDIWTPKLQTVENQTLGPVLSKELEDTIAQQALYEKQLVESEASISKQTGRLIEREMSAKEKAAARIDRLSQESAIATANKEAQIAKAQQKLAIFDNTIEDPTVFNDKISALEAKRLQSQARLQVLDQEIISITNDRISSLEGQRLQAQIKIQQLDQEIMSLDQVKDYEKISKLQGQIQAEKNKLQAIATVDETKGIDKISSLEGQMLSEQNRINEILGEINDVNISRGMSRDQRLLARQQLQAQTNKAIQAANIAETKAQGQLSKEATKITKDLQSERIRLLKQMQQKRTLRQDLNEIAEKLRENLIKQEQIKQTMRQTAIGVDTGIDWARTFGATNVPEQVHVRALEQVKLVDDMVKAGFVKPELADSLRNSVYTEVLATNGIKLSSQKLSKFNLLNETFRWGKVQQKTGIPTNESVQKTIWSLNESKNLQNKYKAAASDPIKFLRKSGISLDDQTEILQYFQKMDDGNIIFSPDAFNYQVDGVTKVAIPVYRGPVLTAEQQSAFKQLREIFDDLAYEANVPRLPRYVPIRELPQYMGVSTKTSAEAIQNATLSQARTSGQLVKGVHETNIINLMDRYTREVARKKFLSPALEDAVDTLNQLHLSGLSNESDAFKKWVFDVFNLNNEKEASQVLGTYKLNQIKPDLDAFVKQLPDSEGALKQIYDALSRAMYVKMVGINPTTWVKQLLQFPTMGGIELGDRWVASGFADATNFYTTAGKERISEVKKILRASLVENSAILESEFGKAPTNKIAKAIDFLNAPSAKVSRHTMEAGEEFNRLQSVLAAQNKFDYYWGRNGEGGIQRLLTESNLTTAQRQMVSRAYLSGGVQNAKDVFSLLMTQRINFAYGLADSPQLLRSEFGRLFPFLTYSRNIFTRGAESIAEGKPTNLAKMVYKPLMLLAAFSTGTKALTGTAYTLPSGSMPIESITELYKFGISATPQIMAKNIYKIVSPVPFIVWDENKFKKELNKKIEVFPEVGKSSPLYNTLLKGLK